MKKLLVSISILTFCITLGSAVFGMFRPKKSILLNTYAISSNLRTNSTISKLLTSSVYSIRVSSPIKESPQTHRSAKLPKLEPIKKDRITAAKEDLKKLLNTPIENLYQQLEIVVSPTTKLALNYFTYLTTKNDIKTLYDLGLKVSTKFKESLRKLKMF